MTIYRLIPLTWCGKNTKFIQQNVLIFILSVWRILQLSECYMNNIDLKCLKDSILLFTLKSMTLIIINTKENESN